MSDSYILHDVMRKVKADGLFDSVRRDLISDLEQKPSYLDLKSSIESSMSSYLAEHQWSSSLKKSELRERARRHIETSHLIKDDLPSMVNQHMQTCQEQLIQPRLSSFVSDHIGHLYHAMGGTHVYRPPSASSTSSSYMQSIPVQQEPIKSKEIPISPAPIKKEVVASKPKVSSHPPSKESHSSNPVKPKIPHKEASSSSSSKSMPVKKKPLVVTPEPVKHEKKTRILSPVRSPIELVDVSPSPPRVHTERRRRSPSPSPPPPIVRIAPPLARRTASETERKSKTDAPRKIKRSQENNDTASAPPKKSKKSRMADELNDVSQSASEDKMSTSMDENRPSSATSETDTRKLRPRRPNPKYSKEDFETGDLIILESMSSPAVTKSKKSRSFKFSSSFEAEREDYPLDTPSSPPPAPAHAERSYSTSHMSPEYGTSLPSPTIEQQTAENNDERSRTPSPVPSQSKQSTSPRRLRPRKTYERSSIVESHGEKVTDLSTRSSSVRNDISRHRPEQSPLLSAAETDDPSTIAAKKSSSSSATEDSHSNDGLSRSTSVPDNGSTSTDESRSSTTPASNLVSKSFVWKPKISK